jgi:hypothetical protein
MKTLSSFLTVTVIAAALCADAAESQWQWRETPESLALTQGDRVLWQLTFKAGFGKPYFHPLSLRDGTCLTALRPADHPWHLGLWWSWKYINGINYWEEDKLTGLAQGLTELVSAKVATQAGGSARVELLLSYHPPKQATVLTEKRVLHLSAPDAQGDYHIDWYATFTAGSTDLKFDRTPPSKFAGGYAGLALRVPPEFKGKGWNFNSSEGLTGATNIYGKFQRWVDYSNGHGIAILDHPQNPRHPTAWYPNENHPFLHPAFLFHEPFALAANQSLRLRYRILLHSQKLDREALDQKWTDFASTRKE